EGREGGPVGGLSAGKVALGAQGVGGHERPLPGERLREGSGEQGGGAVRASGVQLLAGGIESGEGIEEHGEMISNRGVFLIEIQSQQELYCPYDLGRGRPRRSGPHHGLRRHGRRREGPPVGHGRARGSRDHQADPDPPEGSRRMPRGPAAAGAGAPPAQAHRGGGRVKRVIALAGRPNTGKTTLFNALTGMRQRVANFAGCTVEKAVGEVEISGEDVEIVDLPGTHSLLPETEDEKVAFRFLSECAEEGADLQVLCIGEASNLSNCLALTAALKSAGYPVALVVNMIDEARLNGVGVHAEALSDSLGVPVVEVSARHREGLDDLLDLLKPHPLRADLTEALDFRTASKSRLRDLQEEAIEKAEKAAAAGVTLPPRARLPTI